MAAARISETNVSSTPNSRPSRSHGETSQSVPQPTVAESATSWSKDGFAPSQMLGVELPQPFERSTVGGAPVRIAHQARFACWHRDCTYRPDDQGAKAENEGDGAVGGGQIAIYHARASRPQGRHSPRSLCPGQAHDPLSPVEARRARSRPLLPADFKRSARIATAHTGRSGGTIRPPPSTRVPGQVTFGLTRPLEAALESTAG